MSHKYESSKKELQEKDITIDNLTQNLSNKENDLKNKEQIVEKLSKDKEEQRKSIDSLNERIETKSNEIQEVSHKYELSKKELQEKDITIDTLTQDLSNKKDKIEELNMEIIKKDEQIKSLKEKAKSSIFKDNFDEEKERIIIEQTLESYLEYDSKKVPELRKIAKEKGIKFTNKSDTIKLILSHKDNRLL